MKEIALILEKRYKILDSIGEGGSGKTYRALDEENQTEVVIKVLSLRGMSDWKTIELFDREAKILAQLEHPAIPHYLDSFRTEIAGEEAFCLVQELAPGRSLMSWIEAGYAFDETELRDIATQILEILIYLQTFTPPIIHRDIKPQNLLWSESGKTYLVDFGAVRDTYHLTITGGSTIVGTYGYMAPEQFRGQAVLATDLYGLGTTLLYLISGQNSADLPVNQMKIDFRQRVKISPDLANWLDGLLEPIPEDRYRNAAQALLALNGNSIAKFPRPKNPISQISYHGETLKIVVPPIWLATHSSKITLLTASSLLLIAIGSWWIINAAVLPGTLRLILYVMGIILMPWMMRLLWDYIGSVMCQREIEIANGQTICTTKLGEKTISKHNLKFEDIENVHCQQVGILSHKGGIQLRISGQRYYSPEYYQKRRKFYPLYILGKYLDYAEQQWLTREIFEHLQYLDLDLFGETNSKKLSLELLHPNSNKPAQSKFLSSIRRRASFYRL
jgi:eukaryotic-like serine/threonine-protein kinase